MKQHKLLILMVAVIVLTVQAYVINYLAGINYPMVSPRGGDPVEKQASDIAKQAQQQ